MITGRIGSIAVFLKRLRRIFRPGDHAESAAPLGDEIGDELKLRIGKLPRIDIAEQHDVVVHQLFHDSRGTA